MGETGSSGTSAIAVAAAFGAKDAKIRFPGGDLHVRLDGETAYSPARPSRAPRWCRAVVAETSRTAEHDCSRDEQPRRADPEHVEMPIAAATGPAIA